MIRFLACFVLLGMGAAVLPTGASALGCVRPWGTDELAGARMALTEGFGAGDFDGFLIATAVDTERGLSGEVSAATFHVAVAFSASVLPVSRLEVGPHGPQTSFVPGRTYFLTLHESTDPAFPSLSIHPCGPAFEVSSSAELNFLLSLRNDETIVDGGYLSDLRQSLLQEGLPMPFLAIAGAALALVVAVGVFLLPWRRSSPQTCEG